MRPLEKWQGLLPAQNSVKSHSGVEIGGGKGILQPVPVGTITENIEMKLDPLGHQMARDLGERKDGFVGIIQAAHIDKPQKSFWAANCSGAIIFDLNAAGNELAFFGIDLPIANHVLVLPGSLNHNRVDSVEVRSRQ